MVCVYTVCGRGLRLAIETHHWRLGTRSAVRRGVLAERGNLTGADHTGVVGCTRDVAAVHDVVDLRTVAFKVIGLVDPVPGAQAASGGAAREARRDLVRRLPPPHRGVVDRDDCEVVWLDRGYVRGVGDGDGRAAKVGDVGRFTKGVHDVERSGGLLGRSAAVSSRRGRSPRWALN
jgi:hypothetical protein